MRIGSLFSGAGGLDMAVEQVFGAQTVWHCENDSAASKVLKHRWPGVPNHGDITTTDFTQVEPVDVLCGGWPCQPFSLAGKRLGADDERALWPEVTRAVRLLRPRVVVLENVSTVLGPEFSRVANDLAASGYEFCWVCVRASDVGAPHRRERVFIVATDTERSRCDSGFARTPISSGPAGRPSDSGVPADADASGDRRHQRRPEPARLQRRPDAALSGAGVVNLLPTPMAHDAKGTGPSAYDRHSPELSRIDHYLDPAAQWDKYEPAIRRWEHLTRPAPAPTKPNRNGNPRLNPAFSEWMLGWPAGWVTAVPGITRNDKLRIIGNGVVPQQATHALHHLLAISERTVCPPPPTASPAPSATAPSGKHQTGQ